MHTGHKTFAEPFDVYQPDTSNEVLETRKANESPEQRLENYQKEQRLKDYRENHDKPLIVSKVDRENNTSKTIPSVITKSRLQKFTDWIQRLLSIGDESQAIAKFTKNATVIAYKQYDITQDPDLKHNFETFSTQQKERVFNAWLTTREKYYNDAIRTIKESTAFHAKTHQDSLKQESEIANMRKNLNDEIIQATRTMQHLLPDGHILIPIRQANNSFTFNIVDMSHIVLNKPLERQIYHQIPNWKELDPALQDEILTRLNIKDAFDQEVETYKRELEQQIQKLKQLHQAHIDQIKASIKLPEYLNKPLEEVQEHVQRQLITHADFQNLRTSAQAKIVHEATKQYQQRDAEAKRLIETTQLPAPDASEDAAITHIENQLNQENSYKNMSPAIQLDIDQAILQKWKTIRTPEKMHDKSFEQSTTPEKSLELSAQEMVHYEKLTPEEQQTFKENFQKVVDDLKEKENITHMLTTLREEAKPDALHTPQTDTSPAELQIFSNAIMHLEAQESLLDQYLTKVNDEPTTLLEPHVLADTSDILSKTATKEPISDFLKKNKKQLEKLISQRQERRAQLLIDNITLPAPNISEEIAKNQILDELEKQKNYLTLPFEMQNKVNQVILDKWKATQIVEISEPSKQPTFKNVAESLNPSTPMPRGLKAKRGIGVGL